MAYKGFKDLSKKAASDKIYSDLILLKIRNMMDTNVELL